MAHLKKHLPKACKILYCLFCSVMFLTNKMFYKKKRRKTKWWCAGFSTTIHTDVTNAFCADCWLFRRRKAKWWCARFSTNLWRGGFGFLSLTPHTRDTHLWPVWPDSMKFGHFGEILKVFGSFWGFIFVVFGRNLNLLWHIFMPLGKL